MARPPRELRDAPSSNYPRQADFTFEVNGRRLVFPVTAHYLGRATRRYTHIVKPRYGGYRIARDHISISWQASQQTIPDVNGAHVEIVHMTLAYPVDVIMMSPLHIGNHCQTDIIRCVTAYMDCSQMMLNSIALMILR